MPEILSCSLCTLLFVWVPDIPGGAGGLPSTGGPMETAGKPCVSSIGDAILCASF